MFAVDFDVRYVTLHAISRDSSCFPESCLYCQLDGGEEEEQEAYFVPRTDELCKQFRSYARAISNRHNISKRIVSSVF